MRNTSSLDEKHQLACFAAMDVNAGGVQSPLSSKSDPDRLDALHGSAVAIENFRIRWWRRDVLSASDHALDCPAAYFHNNGIAGEAAWVALQTIAEKQGDLYLARTTDGRIWSRKRERKDGHVTKRRYPNSDDYYTEAETIDFVFMQEGSLRFAMNMWHNEMLGSFDPTICDKRE